MPPGRCYTRRESVHWLVDPTVVGSENIGGADTTHIHAGVDVSALLADLSSLLQKASSPANVEPYSQFEAKIKPILQALEGAGGLTGVRSFGLVRSSQSGQRSQRP